jgi:hypothetical protein
MLPMLALVAALAVVGATIVHTTAPMPSADVALGTDEAFSDGPHRRTVTSRGSRYWTGTAATFRFRELPRGPAIVEVVLPPQGVEVAVIAGDVRLGSVPPGHAQAHFDVPGGSPGSLAITVGGLAPVQGPGAAFGALLVRHARATFPGPGLLLMFLAPALAAAAAARLAGASRLAPVFGIAATGFASWLLWPHGLVRSGWAVELAALLTIGALICGILARWFDRRRPGAGAPALAALMFTGAVQVVLATTPVMVVSDVVFHAHKLEQVAAGDLFPVSLTQHATPFQFPYGVAFYALLAPFVMSGLDPVRVVQYGAAVSSVVACAALLWLLVPHGPRRAALAVGLLSLLPITFDVYSYGNLSNVFGQAFTVLFFVWWAGGTPGGWLAGALIVATACLSHFSSFVVVGLLGVALGFVAFRQGALGRVRVIGLGIGLVAALAYYSSFAPLILEQLPRLGEGGGTGRVQRGLLLELWDEVRWLRIRWGLPAIALGLIGFPRPSRGVLDLDLVAYWATGLALAILAVTTPVEVRYVYALTLPLSIAAADGWLRLRARGKAATAVGAALLAGQCVVAAQAIVEAVFHRYR